MITIYLHEDRLYALNQWYVDYKIIEEPADPGEQYLIELDPEPINISRLFAAGVTVGMDAMAKSLTTPTHY